MKKERVYIAGKISGLSVEEYTSEFESAAHELENQGYEVISPIRMVPAHWDYESQMHLCLKLVELSHKVFMLRNWKDSNGAKREISHAENLGKDILFQ